MLIKTRAEATRRGGVSWAPDGTRLAFVKYRPDGFTYIYVIDDDGSNLFNLTNTALDESDPAWRPHPTQPNLTSPRNRPPCGLGGTPRIDVLTGSVWADYVEAIGGQDTVTTFFGRDVIAAGAGDDTILAGDSTDYISGDDGNDRIFGQGGGDRISAGTETTGSSAEAARTSSRVMPATMSSSPATDQSTSSTAGSAATPCTQTDAIRSLRGARPCTDADRQCDACSRCPARGSRRTVRAWRSTS